MKQFKDYSPEKLQAARNKAADEMINNAKLIHLNAPYAAHVTQDQKDRIFEESLERYEALRRGQHDGYFWAWQIINYHLTGECVALLP